VTFYQLGPNQNQPIRIVSAGDGPCLVLNRSILNSIAWGADSSIAQNNLNNTSQIDPLGSTSFTGDDDVWAICLGTLAIADVQQGVTANTVSPAAISEQIIANLDTSGLALDTSVQDVSSTLGAPAQDGSVHAVNTTLGTPAQDPTVTALPGGIFTQGVPLYGKRQNVLSVSNHAITSIGVYTSGHIPMSQIGYDLQLVTKCSATETLVCPFQLFVEWIDSNSGLIVDQQTYYLAGDINGCGYIFHGPIECDTCQITIFNNGSKTNTIVQLDLNGNSIPYRWHDSYSLDEGSNLSNPVNTFTNFDVSNGLIASSSASVPGSGSITRILPLYTGHVYFRLGGGNTGNLQIITQSLDAPTANVISQLAFVATAQNLDAYLPRSQCLMVINNTGATATFSVTGTVAGSPEGW